MVSRLIKQPSAIDEDLYIPFRDSQLAIHETGRLTL